VVTACRTSGDFNVDISDSSSIHDLFELAGDFDAIICCAGEAKWAPMIELSEEDYYIGIRNKLMGQVNIARIGSQYLNKDGSIALTTGILADDPVLQTTSAAMVNGAIHSFVRAAALELDDGKRINAVSCGVVADAYVKYRDYFPGHEAISMSKVVNAYVRSVMGAHTGEIIRVYHD
jgi:NAD(P)-dependent dehydrogenase (short-subunit alcohol dehydrogenase family)